MAAKKTTTASEEIVVPVEPIDLKPLEIHELEIPIEGVTPLIVHKWAEKAKQTMRDKYSGKASTKKPPRQAPEVEAEEATYRLEDGQPGFPASGFKIATVDAARYFDKSVSFELLKRAITVVGEGPEQLVAIEGPVNKARKGKPREDACRIGQGITELRYRNEIYPWKATLRIRYLAAVLTPESVVALVDAGGKGGIGETRPSSPKNKGGTFGTYRVVTQ